MTKAARGPGSPMQLKDSRETMALKPTSVSQKRHAQLVVCGSVNDQDMTEREKIEAGLEILGALGLLKNH